MKVRIGNEGLHWPAAASLIGDRIVKLAPAPAEDTKGDMTWTDRADGVMTRLWRVAFFERHGRAGIVMRARLLRLRSWIDRRHERRWA